MLFICLPPTCRLSFIRTGTVPTLFAIIAPTARTGHMLPRCWLTDGRKDGRKGGWMDRQEEGGMDRRMLKTKPLLRPYPPPCSSPLWAVRPSIAPHPRPLPAAAPAACHQGCAPPPPLSHHSRSCHNIVKAPRSRSAAQPAARSGKAREAAAAARAGGSAMNNA